MPRPPQSNISVLSIAGSDCGGGAGIQADLKTFAAHRVHGLSAITALTAQNTRTVAAVHLPPPSFLRAQIDACFDDFDIRAVKLGMLASAELIDTVADALQRHRPAHVVLDPVMVASSGARLLSEDALATLRRRLLPLADVITPNLPEAELLLGCCIDSRDRMYAALDALLKLGARAALLKGGHLADDGDEVLDLLAVVGADIVQLRHQRLPLDAHGTGCTLSSAIAAELALGHALPQACRRAADYVHRGRQYHYCPGTGEVPVLDHIGAAPTPEG